MRIKAGYTLIGLHILTLALIIVPFLLWGDQFDQLALEMLAGERAEEVFLTTAGLLSMDVFIPVPSSAVSVSAGMLLGGPGAFFACLLGLTVGCLIGYGFGYYFRRYHFNRWYGDDEFRSLSQQLSRYGYLLLLVCRGIPILAELSLMVAGFHRYPFRQFLLVTLIGNVMLAGIYSYLGDSVHSLESVYLLFATFLIIPALTYSARIWWLSRLPSRST